MFRPKVPWEISQTREYLAAFLCEPFSMFSQARFHTLPDEEKEHWRTEADKKLWQMLDADPALRQELARNLLLTSGIDLAFKDEEG